jgi:hypothetical protein
LVYLELGRVANATKLEMTLRKLLELKLLELGEESKLPVSRDHLTRTINLTINVVGKLFRSSDIQSYDRAT